MGPPRGGKGARGGRGSKPIRGGGKKFTRNLRPLDGNGDEMPGMWDGAKPEEDESSGEEESSEEEEEEEESSEEEDTGPSKSKPQAEMTRDEKRAAQKALKDAKRAQAQKAAAGGGMGDGLSSNDSTDSEAEKMKALTLEKNKQPVAAAKGFSTNNLNSLGASGPAAVEQQFTRKEREAIQAAEAKERYRKLHEAGKTDEAKSDLARLALIRKDREEKAKQRTAELEEKKRVAEIKALASGKKK